MRTYNMEAVGIVKVLNNKFKAMNCKDGVQFILQKRVTPSTIKAYKEHDYTLWYIFNNKKYQVTRIVHTARVVTEKEEEYINKYMEEELLMRVYSILLDELNLKSMVDGSFTGYGI